MDRPDPRRPWARPPAVRIMRTLLQRRALETEDFLRYSPFVRDLYSRYQLWRGRAPGGDDAQALARALNRQCSAARMASDPAAEARIQASIVRQVRALGERPFDW